MKFYKNGNYIVCIMSDGTKIRKTSAEEFIPDFSESTDVCITRKCKVGCKFCYESCSRDGRHGDILNYEFINTLHPYTEMAINGNDLDHPQLIEFLKVLRDKKVFANMTVHQIQFMSHINLIRELSENGLIHGIGVSYSSYSKSFIENLTSIPNTVLHVINGIMTMEDMERIKFNDLKILILGYKNIRRGGVYLKNHTDEVTLNQEDFRKNLKMMIDNKWFNVISFDNLAIEQLDVRSLMSNEEWNEFYMGDDGEFTFYIDLVNGTFAKNSLSDVTYTIDNKSIDEMFSIIKSNK